ncbi:Hypothetical protein HVR_LOCUS394 [uncultured virus]|nr:Hypothetical protein HVR_LOCUS394 [uncultured virus]
MEYIGADICITNLKNLVQKHLNTNELSEYCRSAMVEAYNNVTRENACELYSNISSQIISELSLISKDAMVKQIKYSGLTLTSGLVLCATSHFISKYTKQESLLLNTITLCANRIGTCAIVVGFCWFMSIGH